MGWEHELAAVWADETMTDIELVRRIDAVVGDPGVPEAVAFFERAGAQDSTGHPDRAVVGYRTALELGLDEYRARQATVQLASSLRNLGDPAAGLELLDGLETDRGDGIDEAVPVFRALCLIDLGRAQEAVADLIDAAARSMSRYRRSAVNYADELRRRVAPFQLPGSGAAPPAEDSPLG